MNLPIILDLAISLTFIYLILSLIASEIQEQVTILLEWRAKHLRKAIDQIFCEEEKKETQLEESFREKFWSNALLKSLNQKERGRILGNSKGPSYISARSFAEVILYILKEQSQQINLELDKNSLQYLIKVIESDRIPKNLQETLLILASQTQSKIQTAEQQIQEFQKEIENWYERSMERASGVYKRNAKGIALIIGCIIALTANVDTIYLVKTLSKDRTLRSTLDQVAEQIVVSNRDECLENNKKILTKSCLTKVKNNIDLAFDDIAPLPIGWDLSKSFINQKQFNSLNLKALGEALLGWAISGVAISMGSPFWFQLLNKFINVRHTGKKPNSTSELE